MSGMPLRAVDLVFGYAPDRPVLGGVSARLDAGSMCALVGPNGAGKSTLLKLLLGVLRPSGGRVLLDDRGVLELPHRERARRMAYVPQRASLAFAFTVREFVRLGRFAARGEGDAAAADAALERVGLADRADDPLGTLSAGQQQRAGLARALAQLHGGGDGRERFLLADEPVSAMDPRHALEAMSLLRSLADAGLGVVVVLHDLTLASRFCDRALVLEEGGRLAAEGASSEALSPEVLGRVFGVGFASVEAPGGERVLIPSLGGAGH